MRFIPLENRKQLDELGAAKEARAIFKHNTTCSISKGVLERLLKEEKLDGLETIHVLDLLTHRELSDAVAGRFGVPHQSPQVLLISNGRCIYHEWGFDISGQEVAAVARKYALSNRQ